ncbi:hypothetical protein [Methanosarcina sp. WWM596]|nr:hypothetical protein [Methanosarcina sp. WWM596]
MDGVKRVCKKAAKIAFCVVMGAGLIGFVKGVCVGYFIGRHKNKCVGTT